MIKNGFTLVELAIVLVIIGLLTAGVLAGQELVEQSQVRSVLKQLSDYNSSIYTFKTKYGSAALPGDLKQAYEFGLAVNSAGDINTVRTHMARRNGDGDGMIEDYVHQAVADNFGTGTYTGELANFWTHLSNAGFIKGGYNQDPDCDFSEANCAALAGVNFPKTALGNGIVVVVGSDDNGVTLGRHRPILHFILGIGSGELIYFGSFVGVGGLVNKTNVAFAQTLKPEVAYAIDAKLDDGDAQEGFVYTAIRVGIARDSSNAAGCFTTDGDDNNNYNLTIKTQQCTLAIATEF